MQSNEEEFLWSEKYRPHTIADCILPTALATLFKNQVKKGQLVNMILNGSAGVGKTTVAKALCEELGCDFRVIKASEDSGIDVLRTDMRNFASTGSFVSKTKVIILDEAERMSPALQKALLGFMDEFSGNCRFVFTCNQKNRLIPQLHSRCKVIDFVIPIEDRPKLASRFGKRVKEILVAENVTFDEKVIVQLVIRHFPDFRKVLSELQPYASSGHVDEGILANSVDVDITELIDILKHKNFKNMRQWVTDNIYNDPAMVLRKLYDELVDRVGSSGPELVVIIGEYNFKAAWVADQEVNLAAALTEIMARITFKE